MFSFKKKSHHFFSDEEEAMMVQAIRIAEQRTSGEVRLYVESHCRFVDPLDRAAEVFVSLKMGATELKNAVLVYVAIKDKQLAILGDKGIHEKVGEKFWKTEVQKMISIIKDDNIPAGICAIVKDIGEALHSHFPYDADVDKNELPDDIVFGD